MVLSGTQNGSYMTSLWKTTLGTFIFKSVQRKSMWSNENVVLDLIDKKNKTKTYFYGIFAFILIGQLSDCNSEIQTCNSELVF